MGEVTWELCQSFLKMQTLQTIFLSLLVLQMTQALFLGSQTSSCRSDSQCPTFARTRCLGSKLILCFGKSESYTVPGRCLNRSDILCNVGKILGGDRDCNYRKCAECLKSSDCGTNETCSGNVCVYNGSNNYNYNRYNNYNYKKYNNYG